MTTSEFWKWFEENNTQFFFLNQIDNQNEKNRILNEFQARLREYCEHLFFEIGGLPDEQQELIISAGGNKDYFEKVQSLISDAPSIRDWDIIAFKPPMGTRFELNYQGIQIEPDKIWFNAYKTEQSKFNLILFYEDYFEPNRDSYIAASGIAVDTILGEKSSTLDINSIEIDDLSNKDENASKLNELQKLITENK